MTDPGGLLPALSVSAALAQRVIGAAREVASGLAVPVWAARRSGPGATW